ncbi:uncharacterized 38.1 kDa protein-like [Magnolia sinica]|uniref:uncharacterized 38.1 kDa protein-like n=1 Tax=Magnolia sinica TaxID=86752 RepID=UPI00265B5218|nr:uncharacterized 38.1 kDa protein-like [Magnolia sinica]
MDEGMNVSDLSKTSRWAHHASRGKFRAKCNPSKYRLGRQETDGTLSEFLGFHSLSIHSGYEASDPELLPEGVIFQLKTLPVGARFVADGDTITVFVDTSDSRESLNVPKGVKEALLLRSQARAAKQYNEADDLHKKIMEAGYRVMAGTKSKEILAKKYRIRLRGIDAPESQMHFGKESTDWLIKLVQGKVLKINVYCEDRYNRTVGDIYCGGKFVQEFMLKEGMAWHYHQYDKRPELAMWEKEAREAKIGLWSVSDPEKPWDWRRKQREAREIHH